MSQSHALALTLGIEALVGTALLWRRGFGDAGRLARLVAVLVAGSLLTHPLAWHANETWLRTMPFEVRAVIIELSVVAAEALILRYASRWVLEGGLRGWQALVLSAACNAASFGYGLVRVFYF
jgi:hypothetical protein